MFSQQSFHSFPVHNSFHSIPFWNQAKGVNQEATKLDQSTYSVWSQGSTQFSDNNSQSSVHNSKENDKNIKRDTVVIPQSPKDKEASQSQMVDEYAPEIFLYLRSNEQKFMPDPAYMKNIQKDITEDMRSILIDWLVDVHMKFKLLPETMFFTVNLIDRYMSKMTVSRKNLQLVGVTAMLIACKYEEVYIPDVNEFSQITENAYSVKEILKMEGQMLSALEFDLTFTSSNRFLERYSSLCNFDATFFNIAKYMLETAFLDYKMIRYAPSLMAACAVYLTMKITKTYEDWPEVMIVNSQYVKGELFECATELLEDWKMADKIRLSAIRRKFANSKHNEVSKLVLL